MGDQGESSREAEVVVGVIHGQLEHFSRAEPPCRGMQLPDGVLLRHLQSSSLFFYLRTWIEDGKIKTRIFASDSPYDRQKAEIGEVHTSMFASDADPVHMEKLEQRIRDWVDFVRIDPGTDRDFESFVLRDQQP